MNTKQLSLPDASRIAVMGCSYGNVPALTACIEHARERECDAFAFLGDAIGCCGHSNEIIDLVTRAFDAYLAGNLEQQAVEQASGCGCGFASEADEAISGRAFEYALSRLDEAHREEIASWPDLIRIELESRAFLFCHGSPERMNTFLYKSELPEHPWASWCEEYAVEGFFCAHTGFPWTYHHDRFVLGNCGASGKPDHDGDPAVHYLRLDVDEEAANARIHRVTYDADKWVKQLAREGVDEIYRQPLLTGRWTYGLSRVPERERSERNSEGERS